MRRFVVAFVAAALFALAPVGVTLAASSSSLSTTQRTIVTHKSGADYFPMSAAMCTFAKKTHPTLARDPKLCQMKHGWSETNIAIQSATTAPFGAAVAQASSCPSGTSNFHDWIEDADHVFWQYDMDTSFTWYGDCSAPNLNYQNCYLEWSNDTNFTQPAKCYWYNYHSSAGWVSTASVNTVYPCTYIGPFTTCSTDSQRRECYSNGGSGSCNWTAWQGA